MNHSMTEESGPTEPDPTIQLVHRAQSGDSGALDELLTRLGPRLRAIARMRMSPDLRRDLDSSDVMQNTLVRALTGLGRFEMRDESALIRWLSTIVGNELARAHRHRHAHKRDVDRAVDGGESRWARQAGDLPTPSVEIGRREEAEIVQDCVADLPERYREAIILHDYAMAAWDDVGKELGELTGNAARKLYGRATALLGVQLRRRGLE